MATQLREPEDDTVVEQPQGRDFEAEARLAGWKPEEEFEEGERRPPQMKDAETFIRDSEEKAGLQKKTIDHLKGKISYLERQIGKLAKSEMRAYENALADIKRQQREAVETGDVAAHDALEERAETLRKDMSEPAPESRRDEAIEVFDDWREDNPWYDKGALAAASEAEMSARIFADRMMDRHVEKTKTMAPAEFFGFIKGLVDDKYPALGSKPARAKPQSDVAGVTPRVQRNARTGTALPAEAKNAAERYMRQKIGAFGKCKTVAEAHEQMAKDWDWGDAK